MTLTRDRMWLLLDSTQDDVKFRVTLSSIQTNKLNSTQHKQSSDRSTSTAIITNSGRSRPRLSRGAAVSCLRAHTRGGERDSSANITWLEAGTWTFWIVCVLESYKVDKVRVQLGGKPIRSIGICRCHQPLLNFTSLRSSSYNHHPRHPTPCGDRDPPRDPGLRRAPSISPRRLRPPGQR